jgi:hypothetical protein
MPHLFKELLTRIGPFLSSARLQQFQSTVNYLKSGKWMAEQGFVVGPRARNRGEVWDAVIRDVRDKKVLYLEFGVAQGESIRHWSRELKNPESRLHGFDSFEGLPESGGPWNKGQFTSAGAVPQIDDLRVRFFKGWFQNVLPEYIVAAHDVLVINVDADLYTSTSYVLRQLRPHIRNGTFIYFDEMNFVEHEPKAFAEFIQETGLKFRLVSADKTLTFAAFQCIA